jgi:putative acetyltransferase
MEIVIRHAELEDCRALHVVYCEPEVVRGTLQLPYPSPEKWRQRLEEPREGIYVLVACVAGEVIGNLNLQTYPRSPRRKHAGGLGMAVRDDWQGKGVGTALMAAAIELADRWLNLTRLELQVFTDNAAAVHLYEKFGFEIEGTLVRYAFRDGELADVYAMARLV